jgi:hypothetical protein
MEKLVVAVCMSAILSGALQAQDIAQVAYDLTQKDMKPEEFREHVRKATVYFQRWSQDFPDGSMKRFLDDKLLAIAPSVTGGDVKALKKLVYWASLYKEFQEPMPAYIRDIATRYERELEAELKDFSWERIANKIKNRKQEFDSLGPTTSEAKGVLTKN